MMARYTLRIEALSPLALTSGKADVTLDSAIVHDKYGIPLFPAKRLRGLLYESAVEVAEMAELSGRDFLTRRTVAELFRHGEGQDSLVRLSLHDLHPEGYEELSADLAYLMARYEAALSPLDVLEEYTAVRFQTEIDKGSGTARDNSLHNMQAALADDLVFCGEITLKRSRSPAPTCARRDSSATAASVRSAARFRAARNFSWQRSERMWAD